MEEGTARVEAASLEEKDGEMASFLIVDDEMASELSKLLDLFATPPPPFKVRFIDNPYSSSVIFQSSSAYVTINGNEESCGSSFSDSDSSAMANIDVGGAWKFGRAEARDCWMEGSEGEFDGLLTDGFDCRDDDKDAMWVKFLPNQNGKWPFSC